jgi:hypothetical protein
MALNTQPCSYVKTVTTVNCSLVQAQVMEGQAKGAPFQATGTKTLRQRCGAPQEM